jgi:hypothetical protein
MSDFWKKCILIPLPEREGRGEDDLNPPPPVPTHRGEGREIRFSPILSVTLKNVLDYVKYGLIF